MSKKLWWNTAMDIHLCLWLLSKYTGRVAQVQQRDGGWGKGDADKLENIYYGVLSESLLISVLGQKIMDGSRLQTCARLLVCPPEKVRI